MKTGIRCLVACLILVRSSAVAVDAPVVRAAAYVQGVAAIDDQSLRRILDADEVVYILTQETATGRPLPAKTKERYQALKAAGKRAIVDIWWGGAGKFHWDKYNFPDIAQDASLRADFFEKVVDPVIDELGPKNLHGVHLLEETGLWYGYEKTAHPFYKRPTVRTPCIRKYNGLLGKDTGLDMDMEPIWKPEERFAYLRWVSRRLSSAAAHKVFCDHIHRKYPGLKAFQFEGLPDTATDNYTEYQVMRDAFDGIVTDVYDSPKGIYALVSYRTMAPKAEIVALVNGYFATPGTKEEVRRIKKARLKYATEAGMNGIGFFEPDGERVKGNDFENPAVWQDNLELFKTINDQPVNLNKRKLLLVPMNCSVGGYGLAWYFNQTRFANYAMIPANEFRLIRPSDYRAVVILGGSYPGANATWNQAYMRQNYRVDALFDANELNRFVEKGGLLVITGLPLDPEAGLAPVQRKLLGGSSTVRAEQLSPNEWGRRNLKLKAFYTNGFAPEVYQYEAGPSVQGLGENCGYVVRHGKGQWLVLPQCPSGHPSAEEARSYAAFLTDAVRGFFEYAGAKELAEYFE